MSDRRYTDAEVAEILRRATMEPPRLRGGTDDGLTLAQIQDAGSEAGIAPESVAAAARAIDSAPQRSTRTVLGVPVGVSETVELGRLVTDDEWNDVVSTARQLFHAKGRVRQEGAFRSWTNGNLQLMLEPSGDGNRLRMRTTYGNSPNAVPLLGAIAAAFIAFALAGGLGGSGWWAAQHPDRIFLFGGVTLAVLGAYSARLFLWARRRRDQFQQLGERLTKGREW